MKSFFEIQVSELTPEMLKREMSVRGYALIRQVIPSDAVHTVLRDVTGVLAEAGWLKPTLDPLDRFAQKGTAYGDPDPIFKRVYHDVFNLETFHALPHRPELRRVMEMLVGEQVLVHPKPIGRLIFPNAERLVVRAHQDYEFMGGDPEFYTVWVPLHDCPPEVGPLRIFEGSHRYGTQHHERENLHVPEIPVEQARGDTWVGGQVNAGDVLIFHSLTVHAASPNLSSRLRLSLDCRFQNAAHTLNPSNLVFAGQSGKSWEKTYCHWKSDDLKFYWRKLPLKLRPSIAELETWAQMAESESARAKYARMVSQLT